VERFTRSAIAARHAGPADVGPAYGWSVGYLALTSIESAASLKIGRRGFEPWYRFFPSEDWRKKRPRDPRYIMPLLVNGKLRHMASWSRLGWRERLRCASRRGSRGTRRRARPYEMLYEAGP